jgi:hypothetical protein
MHGPPYSEACSTSPPSTIAITIVVLLQEVMAIVSNLISKSRNGRWMIGHGRGYEQQCYRSVEEFCYVGGTSCRRESERSIFWWGSETR